MISAIISHYAFLPEHDGYLEKCVASLDADEIIIIVNDGIGIAKALNRGLSLAKGDFLCVLNNDIILHNPLNDFCDDTAIVTGKVANQSDEKPRSFYVMPRWVYEKVGGYDEQFEVGYWEDNDLIRRWEEAGIPIRIRDIHIDHVGGGTIDKIPERDAVFAENKKRYIAKWGSL